MSTLTLTAGKIRNWRKVTIKKLKSVIRQNSEVKTGAVPMTADKWRNVKYASKNRKRSELNYLMAHERLPLADFLEKIGKSDVDCKLCQKERETQYHLFYECTETKETQNKLSNLARTFKVKNVPYALLVSHTPKVNATLNEAMSIYKESVWHTRCATVNQEPKNVSKEIQARFDSKMKRLTGKIRK